MKVITQLIIFTIIILTISLPVIVYAQTRTITVDNTDRREYTWCPINDQLAKTNISIEGCPLTRVYVNDWNKLSPLQQNTIDTQLRSLGFVDSGEHIIK